jgi:hypothetical protein
VVVGLLGGLLFEDERITAVELRPLTGRDEVWLADCPPELPAAAATSGLLARCAVRAGDGRLPVGEAIEQLLPADRDYLLVWLRRLTYGSRFDAVAECPACACRMDVAFDAGEIPVERRPQQRRQHEVLVRTANGATTALAFHLPTGADQMAAATAPDPARELLLRCVELVDGEPASTTSVEALDEAAIGQLEDAMEGLAPAAELAMDLVCPECGHGFSADYELAPYLLEEMHAGSRAVLREVHGLAFCYHWSEREILQLPRARRRAYLSLVAEQMRRREDA